MIPLGFFNVTLNSLFLSNPLTSISTSNCSSFSTASCAPYTVILDILESIDLIDLPNAKLPLGIILIGTSLLGEVIVTLAVTVLGTISTSTFLPSLS